MKNESPIEQLTVKIPLKDIVTQLAVSFMPITQERHSFIINHISPKVLLENDEHLLSLTFGNLLKNVILLSREQCIQINSTLSGDCTFIQVNCTDERFYNNLLVKNLDLQLAAEKMGCSISVSYDAKTGTTIAFSMSNKIKVS